jgi:hypothetical protein
MGQNGRNTRDDQDWNRDRDREFEDRAEGNRWGDHPRHDRNMQMQRDRFATGQSGYSSGRSGDDPSLDYQNRNSGYSRGGNEDRQAFGTDDRFTGRPGGGDYARDPQRIGQRDSYGDRNYDQSFGGHREIYDHRDDNRTFQSRDYGPSESERGRWTTNTQRGDTRGQIDMRDQGPQGPQGQHRGKGPRGYTRSDERIKETVCEALTDDAHIDASGIDVEVKNGEVTLSGIVPDRQTKRAAEDLVEGLSGVRDVANQLKISDERQMSGRAHQAGNASGNGIVQQDETRKADDKKARA